MARAISIWIISDQKAGHENQSLGLVEALQRLTPVESRLVVIDPKKSAWKNCRRVLRLAREEGNPDLVIGAGHRTHCILLAMKWIRQLPAVLLMKPSIPVRCFDLCLIPEHDLRGRSIGSNVVSTCGVFNRVRYQPEKRNASGLLLVGGPCKEFGWDGEALKKSVVSIVTSRPSLEWTLTDSRRTPETFLSELRAEKLNLNVLSHHETPAGWLPERLAAASTVWTTQDSVSMIYESLSSGASVGLLKMPPAGPPSRLNYGIERLVETKMVTPFGTTSLDAELPPPSRVLAETDRCANEILQRLFPGRLEPGCGQ